MKTGKPGRRTPLDELVLQLARDYPRCCGKITADHRYEIWNADAIVVDVSITEDSTPLFDELVRVLSRERAHVTRLLEILGHRQEAARVSAASRGAKSDRILEWLARGASDAAIAGELGVDVSWVGKVRRKQARES